MKKYIAPQKCFSPERTCKPKVRLRSIAKAKKVLKEIQSTHGVCGVEAYHCKFCNGWHLGHKTKEKNG